MLDVVVSGLGLLVLSPVFAAVALAIRLDDHGPVFFTQTRSGQDGEPFRIWKFRTLTTAPTPQRPTPQRPTPQRPTPQRPNAQPSHFATRVGGVLRAWSIDELPQLWNVLRGDMSLVGPRPTLPDQVARYGDRERRRLQVRPGLTGWAQIHGRNALSWPERIDLDIWYVENWSLALDLRILLRTPTVVLSGTGVDGTGGVNPDFPAADASAPSSSPASPPSSSASPTAP